MVRWRYLMELKRWLKRVMDFYGMFWPNKDVDDPTLAAYD